MTKQDIHLSKSLSWLLRHGAVKEGLQISSDGYVPVEQILQHQSIKAKYDRNDIERVVKSNNKQRFKLRVNETTGNLEIKANQGHSIPEINDTELTPILEPIYKTVVHGTYLKCWNDIKKFGLSRMQRKHIHLAKGTLQDTSIISGIRRNIEVYIFINLALALKEGIKFFESENGVILTLGNEIGVLESKYFSKVIAVKTGEQLFPSIMETNTPQPEQGPRTRDQRNSGPSQTDANRVIVSGYPGGTKPQQLLELFPGSRVETLGWRRATLSFPTGAEAGAAARARVCLDGVPLAVTLNRSKFKAKDKKGSNKRPRPVDKELEPELDPRSIDFEGDFHQQLDAVLAHVRLTQLEVARISQLFDDVETVLQEYWPGCTAHPFGSLTTGLGMKGSDADCLVQGVQQDQGTVNRARKLLRQYPTTFRQIIAIPTAHTPIVKFLHVPTNTRADLSFKTTLGVRNSRLLAFLLHADARAPPVAVAVKYWGKVAGFTGSGKLTNYALMMMTLFYLQQRILPPVCKLQSAATEHMVDGWDTGFDARYEAIPPITCDATIADLIGGFFEFYDAFNFERDVVNPYLGRPVDRAVFADPAHLPPEYDLYRRNLEQEVAAPLRTRTAVCVQDPFEHSHNVASMVTAARADEMRAYIAFAAAAYQREKNKGCVGFLQTILLERPVIQVKRRIPDYRVVMREPYMSRLPADWRSPVREATLRVFHEILKLAMTKADKTTGDEAAVTKERYSAVLVKPIWRRKEAARNIQTACGFVERQRLVTEEILAHDPNEFSVPFKLEIQLSNRRRRAVVSLRVASEAKDDAAKVHQFMEFGQFFLATVQSWIYQLIDTHLVKKQTAPTLNRKENTPPPDDGTISSDEDEYDSDSPVVVTNSAYKDDDVTDVAESLQKSLGIADGFKFNFKLDSSANEVKVLEST